MATRRNSINRIARKALAFEGMDEFQERLGKVVNEVTGAEMKSVMMEGAIVLRDDARRRAPVKTGALRKNIFASRGDENRPSVLVGVSYKAAPHAHLVEWGHGGPKPAGPKPFMRPAIDSTAPRIQKILKDGFNGIIERNSK